MIDFFFRPQEGVYSDCGLKMAVVPTACPLRRRERDTTKVTRLDTKRPQLFCKRERVHLREKEKEKL